MARHLRTPWLLAAAAAFLLLIPALGAQAVGPPAPAHTVVQVSIQNFAFSPRTLVIASGTTVVWTNRDMAPHTVTSDSGAWMSSARLDAGQSFSLTFSNPGTYTYHCAVHPYMTATVVVRATTPAPAPPLRTSIRQTVPLHPLGGSGVSGSAVFSYNAASGRTTVLLTVQHLRPGTVHPVHIHAGSNCTANRPILSTFVPTSGMGMTGMGLRADRSGTIRGRTTLAGSFRGQTWHINVHTGPGLATTAQFRVLACGVLR